MDPADHQVIHPQWNDAIKIQLRKYFGTDGSTTFMPGIDRAAASGEIMTFVLKPGNGSLCAAMGVNPVKTVRWKSGGKETTGKFVAAIRKYGGDKLSRALSPGLMDRAATLISKLTKTGKTSARKIRQVSLLIGAYALLTKSPLAAAAGVFNVTEEGVLDVLNGTAVIGVELVDPAGSVRAATFADGRFVQEGDQFYRARVGALGIVVFVVEGEVDYLTPTGVPGVYDVTVRFGQESRTYQGQGIWRIGEPIEGLPLPPGWKN